MKKQLAIATVAIMLTAVLIVPTVMAFALWDENSVQYSSHWSEGYNSITHESVTASNQSISIGNGIWERESSSRLKYYGAPVPVRTYNWSAIVMGTGIRDVSGISWYSIDESDGSALKKMSNNPKLEEKERQIELYKEGKNLVSKAIVRPSLKGVAPGCLRRNVRVYLPDFLNGTITLLP